MLLVVVLARLKPLCSRLFRLSITLQVYFTNSCQQIWVRANQPFILLSSEEKEYYEVLFYHTDLVQNAVFHNFSRQIAFIQYSGPSKQAWTFSETVQKISKITHLQFAKKFKRVTLQHDKEFIVFIFY